MMMTMISDSGTQAGGGRRHTCTEAQLYFGVDSYAVIVS